MQTIELIVRIAAKRNNEILLCKSNEEGRYFLPGGHVEFGDSLIDTIYKELYEEIGLERHQIHDISYKDFLENFFGDGENRHHELNMIFSVLIDEAPEIRSKENHIDFKWVRISELQNINFLPKEMISKL